MAEKLRVVFVTISASQAAAAEKIAVELIQSRLAACVSVVPGVVSFYTWEGQMHRDQEFLMIAKARASTIGELARFVRERHPAKTPEIIAMPVEDGDKDYMEWAVAATNRTRPAN